jgi:hypothetical protein
MLRWERNSLTRFLAGTAAPENLDTIRSNSRDTVGSLAALL